MKTLSFCMCYKRLKLRTANVNQSKDLICIHGCHVVITSLTTKRMEPNIGEYDGWALFYRPKEFKANLRSVRSVIYLTTTVCCDVTTCGLVDTYRNFE